MFHFLTDSSRPRACSQARQEIKHTTFSVDDQVIGFVENVNVTFSF